MFRMMLTSSKYFPRSINRLAFIMEKLGVFCEMGNSSLKKNCPCTHYEDTGARGSVAPFTLKLGARWNLLVNWVGHSVGVDALEY